MPELPEVETVRRTLLPHVVGQRIETVRVLETRLRQPVDVAALTAALHGRIVLAVRRRAKYLLFDLEGDSVMLVHLGMSGRLGVVAADRPLNLHDHVVWNLQGARQLRFNDARRFGMVDVFAQGGEAAHPRLRHLGVEPLDALSFTAASLYIASRGVAKPIKNFLMDGNRIVGVGNIYACESLFTAGIHPSAPAGKLSASRWERLVEAVRVTLISAIEEGGTTLRDFANVEGQAGYFAVRLQVYGRTGDPCTRCGRPIRRVVQAGRSTFYCPACQH